MALICIAIGIGLALKNEDTRLPSNQIVTFDEHTLLGKEFDSDSERDILGTDANANILSGEPTYVDIDINEADSHDENMAQVEEDENATSYEDDLTEQDDVDSEMPNMGGVLISNAEVFEDLSIALAQGDISDVQAQKVEPETNSDSEKTAEEAVPIKEKPRKPRHYSYTVTRGDKLRDVLEQSGLSVSLAKALERKFPQLASLQTGQQFQWGLDADGDLEYMHWLVSEKEEQRFERKEKNKFSVRKIEKKGVWKQDVVKGTINGNFVASMKSVGLSARQIQQLASGLQWQISTAKLKKGDKFAILVKREYINGKVTDLGNVEALHIISGNKSYYAIQAENGRYYSRHGETLGKGFSRYPLQFTPRISSSFNPNRRHPISKRVRPHNGVDFAVPTGTPIIAPADGIVEHVAYQAKGAGRYIKIRHGGQYTTVYMHLSKQLVKVGQSVRKGERIALSGNTGGSTGPHLHYEFHINGNPVNPITVRLPGTGSGMPNKERKAFLAKAKNVEARLKL